MEYIISYSVSGTIHVEAPTPEIAECVMRANMANEIIDGVDLDTLRIDGIEIDRGPERHRGKTESDPYVRKAV